MRRASVAIAVVVATFLAGGACSGSADGDAPGEGAIGEPTTDAEGDAGPFEVIVATGNDLITLDPQAVQDYPGRVVYGNVFEPLVARSPEGELVPALAAEMPTSVDQLTWEVSLRDDVTWQDGSPFSADDVAYAINRVIDPDYQTQQATLFNTITGAEAVDPTTVRITTREPDPVLLSRLSLLLIVKSGDADRGDFAERPVGTGPYSFVSREPAGDTVIERWDGYREPLEGAPDRLVLRVMPEPRTRTAALERGEVDIVPALSPDDVPLVPRAEAVTGTETMLLRLNNDAGPLVDQRLRKAIDHAINREELVEALFSGYAEPATCQIAAETVFGHDPTLDVPEFDPDESRRLLDAAGDPNPSLSMTAPAGRFAKGREVAQVVEQYLEDVGFEVALEFPSDQVMAQQLLQPPRFPDVFMYSANTEFFDETKQLQWLTSDGQFSGAADETIDQLAEQVQQELDEERREELFSEINQRACELATNVYLYVAQDLYGLSTDIEWTPRRDGFIVAAEISRAAE